MFELAYVSAAVMFLTEATKRWLKKRYRNLDPAVPVIIALLLGAALNVANAWIFGDLLTLEAIRNAIKDGLTAATATMGIYAGGKKYLETQLAKKLSQARI